MTELVAAVVSALALAVSVISAFYSFRLQSLDSRRSTREQLNKAVSELIKLNAENNSLWYVPTAERDQNYYQKQGAIVQTAVALSRQALYLAEQQPELVTDIEYYTIAQGLVMAGDYSRADDYWQKAIKAAPTPFYKITNMRMYADFLFNQAKHESGRALYQEALKILNNDTDQNKYTNAFTYQMWMLSESNHRFWEEADASYHRAKRLYETLSHPSWIESGLAVLQQTYEGANTLRSASRPAPNLALTQGVQVNTAPEIASKSGTLLE